MSSSACYFDSLYADSDDPWGFRNRWYERRKRRLTLAMLPRETYRHAFEPGCANGELSAQLADRCERLIAADLNETAVRLAGERLAGWSNVRVEQLAVPQEWPTGSFDLIVVSELAYYLGDDDLARLAQRIEGTLTADGTLVACHWRRGFDAALRSATHVHALLDTRCGLSRLGHYEDADMLLDVWTREPRSVAEHEGLA